MHECHRPAERPVEVSAGQASDPICGTRIDFRHAERVALASEAAARPHISQGRRCHLELGEYPPTIPIPRTARPSTDAALRTLGVTVAPWTFVAQVLP